MTASIDEAEQSRRADRFAPFDGGKIVNVGPMAVGGWWSPDEGWTFLRLNKRPTRRQVEAADAKLKELYELFRIREEPAKPAKP